MNSKRYFAKVYRAVESLRRHDEITDLEIERAYKRYLKAVDEEPRP